MAKFIIYNKKRFDIEKIKFFGKVTKINEPKEKLRKDGSGKFMSYTGTLMVYEAADFLDEIIDGFVQPREDKTVFFTLLLNESYYKILKKGMCVFLTGKLDAFTSEDGKPIYTIQPSEIAYYPESSGKESSLTKKIKLSNTSNNDDDDDDYDDDSYDDDDSDNGGEKNNSKDNSKTKESSDPFGNTWDEDDE